MFLYLAIVYDNRTKLLPRLCIVKSPSGFTNLDQEGLPLVEVFPEAVINVLSLHVPQALVLQPYLFENIREAQ